MKYVFLIAALNAGGSERVMTTIANSFVDKGHEVLIVTFNDGKSFYELSHKVEIIGLNTFLPKDNRIKRALKIPTVEITRFVKILSIIRRYKPKAVLSFCFVANILNVFQGIINRNIITVVSERNDPTEYGKMTQAICKRVYIHADHIVCQSEKVKHYYLGKRQINNKISVIPNPLNIDSLPEEIASQRINLIVGVGRLIAQKNFNLLIRAFARFHEHNDNYVLQIYGQGPLEKDLRELIVNQNMEKFVFLMGIRPNVMKHIYNAKCFVMSSDYEGFPNVLIEAMASGIPVISTNFHSGIASELIEVGVNGYLVEPNNENQMVDALQRIVNSDIEIISKHNFLLRDKYDNKVIVNQWERVLQ